MNSENDIYDNLSSEFRYLSKYLLFIIILFLRLTASASAEDSISINILSKYIRLIDEGKISAVIFTFSKGTITEDKRAGAFFECGHLRISKKNSTWIFDSGPRVASDADLIISHPENGTCFTVNIEGEKRSYPLPAAIRINNKNPEIVIREKPETYALNSASAEYGTLPPEEKEALSALALVILSRCEFRKKNPAHSGYDFCDLTHCQVYRGTLLPKLSYNDDWEIDTQKLRNELLFHSRCGGATFDGRVIGAPAGDYTGIKDILYREGKILCFSNDDGWDREITSRELRSIFDIGDVREEPASVKHDDETNRVLLAAGKTEKSLDMENFRLTVNRVRGWNFLKSNNYAITAGENSFHFAGRGLGHGIGLCQHGALELARRGYSRYEIIEHYYPAVTFIKSSNSSAISPYISYCLFDIPSGKIEFSSSTSLRNRVMPPGSIWKIIVSLYLAKEREDLFREYRYNCAGTPPDTAMPERCWHPEGHGELNLINALPRSCNLYFASLYSRIKYSDFKKFYAGFCSDLEIKNSLPDIKSGKEWAALLGGLDFKLSITPADMIKIAGIIHPDENANSGINLLKKEIPQRLRMELYNALHETFLNGTAREMLEEYTDQPQYLLLKSPEYKTALTRVDEEMWGKTSTVIDGTNKPLSCGIFLGGKGNRGIIVILRRGNGHLASQWAKILLDKNMPALNQNEEQ